jgi:glycerol dehydrogenase
VSGLQPDASAEPWLDIDTARAAAADAGVPAVATPTLASNDAPWSALSVIYTPEGVVERLRFMPRHPLLVLADNSVTARAPKRQLLAGIGDALATWYEARSVQAAHRLHPNGGLHTTSVMALGRLCVEILLADASGACAAVDVQAVTPALERVIEANILLSGLGFENGGVCVAHAVHDGITVAPR